MLARQVEDAGTGPQARPEDLLAALATAHEELRAADEEVRAQCEAMSRLVESHQCLRLQQERMVAILPVPVLVTDVRGTIRSVNAAAALAMDMRVAHLLGKPLFSLFSPDDRAPLRGMVTGHARGSRDGVIVRRTATLVPRRGPQQRVEVTGSIQLPGAADGEIAWVLLAAGEYGVEPARVTDSLAALAMLPRQGVDTHALLVTAATVCARALGAEVTITLGDPEEPTAVASSSQLAQACDGAQLARGEGPTMLASAGTTVVAPSLLADDRWPRLRPHLPPEAGSVVATPIGSGDAVTGTLTAYGDAGRPVAEETLVLLAVALAGALRELELLEELARLERDMDRALASRSTIDQAKGIVMGDRGIDADAAWQHLVELSSRRNRKVRDIAAEIVAAASGRAAPTTSRRPPVR